MIAKISVILAVAAVVCAQYHDDKRHGGYGHGHGVRAHGYGHGHGVRAHGYGHGGRSHGYSAPSYKQESYDKPKPYAFDYHIEDDYKNQQSRQESGDDYGNVKGSYGYQDAYGLYRQVEYTADDYGFRAYIKTNEPGTDNQNPADVEIYADPQEVKYEAPKKGYGKVAHAPSYQHGSYAGPSYGHRASYAPVHKVSHASVHRRGYSGKNEGYGHDSHVNTHRRGYSGKAGYGHDSHVSTHKVGYKAPAYHGGVAVASTHRRGYDDKKGGYGHASHVVTHKGRSHY